MSSANTQNYFSSKYNHLYMDLAKTAAKQSVAGRLKVGAAIVTPSGLISIGWNGTPAGFPNTCEDSKGLTKPSVIHAEHNAIKKFLVNGTPVKGSKVYVTTAPCASCALLLVDVGIQQVYYLREYKNLDGIKLLAKGGVECIQLKGRAK